MFPKQRKSPMSRGLLAPRLQKVYAKHLAYIQADLRPVYIKYMTASFSVVASSNNVAVCECVCVCVGELHTHSSLLIRAIYNRHCLERQSAGM